MMRPVNAPLGAGSGAPRTGSWGTQWGQLDDSGVPVQPRAPGSPESEAGRPGASPARKLLAPLGDLPTAQGLQQSR